MKVSRRLHAAIPAVLTALAVGLTACGGDDGGGGNGGGASGGGGTAGGGEPTTITVQETAGVPSAFVAFGIDQGFFRDCGLEIELEAAQGGAATVPALINGDVQIGGSNVVSLLLAEEKGLPLRVIAPGTSAQQDGDDFAALIVAGDSEFQSAQDLSGATIAVNTLDNIAEVVVKRSLEEEGVDISSIELTEVPFPEMNAAVDGGDVDAGFQIEPFLTRALNQDARVINYSYVVTQPSLQVGAYAVTRQYAEENPEVISCYQQAVAENADYIAANEEEFRTFLTERAEIAQELASEMRLPQFTRSVNVESLQLLADLMAKYGLTEQAPDVSALVGEGASG